MFSITKENENILIRFESVNILLKEESVNINIKRNDNELISYHFGDGYFGLHLVNDFIKNKAKISLSSKKIILSNLILEYYEYEIIHNTIQNYLNQV